ncbi:MAG: hypothetical protein L3J59_05915 [Methylococcaceae bacterium]|nr:hypothetical protein [Methylococcaceae bacterium]
MKKLLISIFLIWCGYFISLGVSNASDCLRFVINDKEFLQLEKEDVQEIEPNVDAEGKNLVEVKFTDQGQLRLKEFTEKNIGNTLLVYFNDLLVSESIPIRMVLDTKTLLLITKDEYISSILMGCK